MNDINESLDLNNLTSKDIELLSIYRLLFADDITLFTTDLDSLQSLLNNVYVYSSKWGLKINVNKTKVCIFEKRKTRQDFVWTEHEIVNSFTYLGIKFHYIGCMKHDIQTLHEQALKAYNSLLSTFSRITADIRTKLSLFDSVVVPILLYGSEIWGFYNYKEVDRLHLKFCKQLLGVKFSTSNAAVVGKLGRYPLSLKRKERAIKYWLKVMNNNSKSIYSVFIDQLQYVHINRSNTWARSLISSLNNLGFGDLLYSYNSKINYLPVLIQRLKDQYLQEWNALINNQPKLYFYRLFKNEFKFEKYLDVLGNDVIRNIYQG